MIKDRIQIPCPFSFIQLYLETALVSKGRNTLNLRSLDVELRRPGGKWSEGCDQSDPHHVS